MKLLPFIAVMAIGTAAMCLAERAHAYDICAKQNMPPMQVHAPSVRTDVIIAPAGSIVAWCHKDPRMQAILNGCTFMPKDTPNHHGLVLLSDALNDADRVCVLTYEFAHLPPNNWQDPVMEATAPNDPTLKGH